MEATDAGICVVRLLAFFIFVVFFNYYGHHPLITLRKPVLLPFSIVTARPHKSLSLSLLFKPINDDWDRS